MQRKTCTYIGKSGETCSFPIFARKLCKHHDKIVNPEKYKPLKSGSSLKKAGTKIKPVSDKLKKELELYYQLRDEYMLKINYCERCGSRNNLTLHHKRGRGKYLLMYFCTLCMSCHEHVHAHPKEAEQEGFLISRI